MKKRFILIALACAMIFSSCGEAKPTSTKENELYAVEPTETFDPFYVEMMEKENVRPIALMIDNDNNDARPQVGLEDAYIVYEIVVEGRATRFMALFKDFEVEKVGPVRSSRHYFLDYALEHDAIYAHAGWSPKAAKDISALGVNNINGVTSDGECYWRDNTYNKTWHNLYTSTVKLSSHAESKKKYRMDTTNAIPNYNKIDTVPESETDGLTVTIPYANFYKVSYKYDADSKRYIRYINGSEHKSQTGEALSTKNIIMYQVKNFNLPDSENKGRQDLQNVGSGTGYYLSDGKLVNIKWEKTERTAKTVYTLEDGTPLYLNPGNTFIQIVPTYSDISFD